MPPPLALLLYFGFVAVIFRIERPHFKAVSWAVWLPTIWILYTGSKPLARWLAPYSEAGDADPSGSAIDRYFLTILICLAWVVLIRRQFEWRDAVRRNSWLMLLLGYMFISILWSDVPGTSFKRWVREFGTVTMAFVIFSERSPKDAMERILRRTIIFLIPLSLVLIKYFPELGIQFHRWTGERMWVGVTLQKNGIGRLCVISAFYLIWSLARWWRSKSSTGLKGVVCCEVMLLGLTVFLLKGPSVQAYSATAVMTLLLGLSLFGFLQLMRDRPAFWPVANLLPFLLICGIATGVAVPLIMQQSSIANAASTLGRDATFTGRTDIWASLIPLTTQNPLLGEGFGSFWTQERQEAHQVGEAHNGYLDMRLELGYLGILLMSIFMFSAARKAVTALRGDFHWAALTLCFFTIAVVHNLSESSINNLTTQLTALIVFVSVVQSRTPQLKEDRASPTVRRADIVSADSAAGTAGAF